jgi:zinc transport system substrate-binding protein
MIEVIAEELSNLDPVNRDIYEKNASEYIKELDTLDKDIKNILNDVTNRKFIAFHPAFAYFASDYNLTMYALEEEGKEATPKHLEDMIDLANKENIKVIFYQSEIDSSQSKAFAEEIGGKTVMLSPLADNYIDNLRNMASALAEGMQ